jgi:hypothetical protein
MSKYRRAAKIDSNQNEIVKELRKIPGVTVEVNHDDILVGYKGKTYWYELKDESAVSKKTGKILESSIKDSQKKLRAEWAGHYKIVSSLEEILKDIGIIYP